MIFLRAFKRQLSDAPRVMVLALLVSMVLGGLTEGIGILLLVPLLQIIQGAVVSDNVLLQGLLGALTNLGIPVTTVGLLTTFLLLIGFRSVVQYARDLLGAGLQHRLVDQLRLRCFSSLLKAEWRWVAAGRQSDHANLLLTDVSRVGMGLHFGLGLLATLATMLAYLLAALALSWKLTVLALLSGGVVLWLLSGQRRKALQLGQSLGSANRAMHGNVQESLAGIKLAKILGNEKRQLKKYRQVVSELRQEQLQFVASTSLSRALFQFGGAAILAGYLYAGLVTFNTPMPELLTLVLVFSRLIPMFASAQQQYQHWLHALPAKQEIDQLLAECQDSAEPECPVEPAHWPVAESICLERIVVRYTERDRPALDDLSVCFPAQTTTAIMGASGAGKSTLADILMGLLTPDEGVLRVDGVAVVDSDRLRWRHSVVYVPQEVFLFNDTVRNNLLWGQSGASDDVLAEALRRAAADFIFSLPQGLDTVVGDGGVRLSGGERQRLALARALLRKPSLLILDEATSALDVENEERVRAAIENLQGDMTVVIIGHRLPTLEHADQVIILNEGRISAQGTWDDVRNLTGIT